MNRKLVLLALIIGPFAFIAVANAQESGVESKPIASDAAELNLPSTEAFEPTAQIEKAPWSWRESLKNADPFFRDMTLSLNVRTFYFARQDGADEDGNDKEKISWAIGGSAKLDSGKLYDMFSMHSEVFTSQRLYGPQDKDGALLLEPGQDSYTVLGVANPRFEYERSFLSLYRQRHELPYVNNQDNRMTPNTFESYNFGFLGDGEKPPIQVGFGYLDKIKKRNSDNFVSMSEAAGVTDGDRGMPWLGFRFRPIDEIKFVAVDYAGIDFLNIFYTDLEYSLKLSDDLSLKSSVQYSEQRSMGDDLLTGESFSTAMWGVQQAVSYKKFMVRAALTVDDKTDTMRSPYGSYPGYNSAIVDDFNQAGMVAWKGGISYDFSDFGLDGVTAYADYISGSQAVDSDLNSVPDKNETDLNIDYRIKEGLLKDVWLRLRGGFVHQDTVGTTQDYRIIFNYPIPII